MYTLINGSLRHFIEHMASKIDLSRTQQITYPNKPMWTMQSEESEREKGGVCSLPFADLFAQL